ncbi:ammonium transporter [Corynebacterium liangguodongii]|uniref:Ammonium transporter n=1 Tax=Corynebacterium liangguodongii TaxID=2079535 RepID=A0A2S0WF23_9CORY|nr:ammonium transporter [Corynebacterium liangguodongii]AWB84262.1 ammonium transporter [Corynebacterium liangguodongii]PWC00271.1 ammonium transporter [Corynebacterium liangguodongii]
MVTEEVAATAGNSSWMLVSASLVLLMTPALALFYGGMSSRRSVLNMMMMSFTSLGIVTVVYVLWGWSMSYGGQSIGGVFANPFEFFGLRNSIVDAEGNYVEGVSGYANIIDIGFQLTFAVISTAIISGAIASRVKIGAWIAFSAAWASLVYFPLAHMVWGGGLLGHAEGSIAAAMFGTADGEAAVAPIDFAGGTVVHISAGTAALVLALVIGRRRGFPTSNSRPHNLPMVMLGAALLWFGWFGFNAGSAFAADGLAGLAWVNTTAAAAAAMMGWLLVEKLRDGFATSLGASSGVVAGLVAITPAAGALQPVSALVLGFIGGILACFGVGLKYTFNYDDSLDVVGVHLVAGLWGTIGLAFFAGERGMITGNFGEGMKLLAVQVVIAVVSMLFAGVMTLLIALAITSTMGWRISREEEFDGVDYAVHRETGYDLGGPGLRPGGVPAGNKSAAEMGLNEARSQHSTKDPAPAAGPASADRASYKA